ncbi:5-oxoprolinase subunit PxpA [Pseudoalteromonas sp. MMG013]|uniref:5-oxoprolinase subunit PxpA n=1 Tax=unclassified Pseudoalteromonas TaxID=194690 RepID=UPI001B380BBB|nr:MULTISPECIES: 5-oxoprolinase subunit PxpA [unclassified Pseudoalteromonas]MBQ4850381.1 5-oxoprolinase subunit PxpA [Pseudoalteromonas sp. MMG012]MBQ4860451.1 5-oxoprolinase subunit PxpA [Pseudoalteromonas sp. MMG013]
MLLNCDLGESFGAWTMGLDTKAMAEIDCANIACGFHAGDPDVIAATLQLAKQHNVTVGAHPSYPDKQGFGRRSMQMQHQELIHCLHYQIAALEGMAKVYGITLKYVKPHGALYNDMMRDNAILKSVLQAIADYPSDLKLMMLATRKQSEHRLLANTYNVAVLFEAFADRLYTDDGLLSPRSMPTAVHDKTALLAQVTQLITHQSVQTNSGKTLPLAADTLCVHGDNEDSIALVKEIRALLNNTAIAR